MQKTTPYYYQQTYERELSAIITEITTYNKKPAVILDQTICYPEGGGQPGDIGKLGNVSILDTVKDSTGQILHVLSDEPQEGVGEQVRITIDWEHRYDYMQQHTAQHLLSGTLYRLFTLDTVSVHLGHDSLSVEVDTQELSTQDIDTLEQEVNQILSHNIAVTAQELSLDEAQKLGLRRSIKVDGDVRIVRIGEYDAIACGGIHVQRTHEIEAIQFLRMEPIRGRVKTYWLAGARAVNAIRRNRKIVDAAGTLLSVPPEGIVDGIESVYQQLSDIRYRVGELSRIVAQVRMDEALKSSQTMNNVPAVVIDATPWADDIMKYFPETLFAIPAIMACIVRTREDGKLTWQIALKGCGNEIDRFNEIRNRALPIISGKGGGKPPLWQGIGLLPDNKDQFIDKVMQIFAGTIDGKSS